MGNISKKQSERYKRGLTRVYDTETIFDRQTDRQTDRERLPSFRAVKIKY
jgi:hypothetical protein